VTRGPIRSSTELPDGRALTIEIDVANDLIKATIDGEPPPAVMTRRLAFIIGVALTNASGVLGQERARREEQAADRADRKAAKAAAKQAETTASQSSGYVPGDGPSDDRA